MPQEMNLDMEMIFKAEVELTLLFDGACPFCCREVNFLRAHDHHGRLGFVDIDAPGYEPTAFAGITYRQAMGRMHALRRNGQVVRDVAVFREAYQLVGMGWLYAPTAWPGVSRAVDGFYQIWARLRLRFTGRESLDQLCSCRINRP
ncbi:MAG: thiol-disulfide oxidoreductase DCC family protein [Prochlorococcus sp.]|nr:DUF393 domain-containing protein [Prochlorococcaceae cyanobacterium ETNP18_MAG_14]MDP6310338.1 DUF393 domain-containing protein [Prochlorococcaceae cyanobacterium ETNP14_MAG_4]HJM81056.1 DUF393 domain-containing protein [Prochlorococcaceae cyanobacterium Fu_MAG_72]